MTTNSAIILSRNVRRLMTARGWGLMEAQRHSGVSKTAIGNLLNYKDRSDKHPTTKTVDSLASAFGVPAWQLLCPPDQQPVPGTLDAELLAAVIRAAADGLRAHGVLPTDAQVAQVAATIYKSVANGVGLARAQATALNAFPHADAKPATTSKRRPAAARR